MPDMFILSAQKIENKSFHSSEGSINKWRNPPASDSSTHEINTARYSIERFGFLSDIYIPLLISVAVRGDPPVTGELNETAVSRPQ